MATNIPLGFHIWSATFTVTGSTHNNVITCGGRNAGFLTAASINTAWRSGMAGTGAPLLPGAIPTGWTWVESKVLANIGGLLYTDVNTTIVAGAGASTPPPMNTALIVKKECGISGRPYQARFFAPPAIQESTVDAAGQLTGPSLSAIQSFWTAGYNNLQTLLLDPVIIHDPALGLIPTKITAFTVKGRLGTIGRRMRR